MLRRCIHDELNSFKLKVNITVYAELVENFYMEPPDGGCVGSFVETPVASNDFNNPSTSKGKVQRNDYKEKYLQKQKERKDVVKKDIRSFFGWSTIVKSSGHLIQKKSKYFKVD